MTSLTRLLKMCRCMKRDLSLNTDLFWHQVLFSLSSGALCCLRLNWGIFRVWEILLCSTSLCVTTPNSVMQRSWNSLWSSVMDFSLSFMVEMYFKPHNLHINQRFNLIQWWGERGGSLQWDHNQHTRRNIDASCSHIHHIKKWRINSSFKASADATEGRKINKDYLKERRAANGAHSEEKIFNISFNPLRQRTTSFLGCGPDYWRNYVACVLKV